MKQTSYEVIVKCVLNGAPALAKEIVEDLNATLEELDKFKKEQFKPVKKSVTKKEEN